MKIFYNQTSPYARKVRIVVLEKNLNSSVEMVDIDPWADPAELVAATPLSKVPALVTDQGLTLTESDTIVRYLEELHPRPALLPMWFAERSEVAARMGLLQGLIDAAFDAVIEKRRPAAQQWADWVMRQHRALERGLPVVAAWERPADRFDLGDVSLACLLGYLDFRIPQMKWRASQPALAEWFDRISQRPSVMATRPA